MKKIVFIILFGGSIFLSNDTVSAKNFRSGEGDNCIVTSDLVIKDGSIGFEKLTGSLKGKITNFSREYSYGKIQLKVKFLDYMGNELGTTTTVVLDRNIKSGESDFFLEHLKAPKHTDHVQCEIVCAEIATQ
jgi:hypothetical protein